MHSACGVSCLSVSIVSLALPQVIQAKNQSHSSLSPITLHPKYPWNLHFGPFPLLSPNPHHYRLSLGLTQPPSSLSPTVSFAASHPHPAPHLPHLHPPLTPRSSLSHSKSQVVQEPAFAFGALACLPPPPTPGQGLLLFLLLPTRGKLLYSPGLVSGARQSDSVPCSFPGDFPV